MVDLDESPAAARWDFAAALSAYEEQDERAYNQLCNGLRAAAAAASLPTATAAARAELATALRACDTVASRLDKRHEAQLVATLVHLNWLEAAAADGGAEVGAAYAGLMASLLAVHNHYIEEALKRLLQLLYPAPAAPLDPVEVQLARDRRRLEAVLAVLAEISSRVPAVMGPALVSAARPLMLHARRPYPFAHFFAALLHRVARLPAARAQHLSAPLLRLLLESVRAIDAKLRVCATPPELEPAAAPELEAVLARCLRRQLALAEGGAEAEARLKLDTLLWLLLRFLREECCSVAGDLDMGATVRTHRALLAAFEAVLLPAAIPRQTHFLLLFMCGVHDDLLGGVLNYLWKRVLRPSLGETLRLASLAYLVDLVARCQRASAAVLRQTLTGLRQYAALALRSAGAGVDYPRQRLLHGLCHALMYLVWFRHEELLAAPAGRRFLRALRLDELLAAGCNPLLTAPAACRGDWLAGFLAVMAVGLGDVSCQAVMEMNRLHRLLRARAPDDEAEGGADSAVTPLATPFARFELPLSGALLDCGRLLRPVPPPPPALVLPPDLEVASIAAGAAAAAGEKLVSGAADEEEGWFGAGAMRKRRREPSEVLQFGVDVALT